MARRLLGPEGPDSLFGEGQVLEPQPVQVLSPSACPHRTLCEHTLLFTACFS